MLSGRDFAAATHHLSGRGTEHDRIGEALGLARAALLIEAAAESPRLSDDERAEARAGIRAALTAIVETLTPTERGPAGREMLTRAERDAERIASRLFPVRDGYGALTPGVRRFHTGARDPHHRRHDISAPPPLGLGVDRL